MFLLTFHRGVSVISVESEGQTGSAHVSPSAACHGCQGRYMSCVGCCKRLHGLSALHTSYEGVPPFSNVPTVLPCVLLNVDPVDLNDKSEKWCY